MGKLKTIDIKGKPYVTVNERIKAFRKEHPNYSIITEIHTLEDGMCLFYARIENEEGRILATGHAYEKDGSTYINKTSYIENAETSAIGRALGALGIGVDDSYASAEDVLNAVSNQEKKPAKVTSKKVKTINPEALNEIGRRLDDCTTVEDLSEVKKMFLSYINDFAAVKSMFKSKYIELNQKETIHA
jgi:hypothetical protein